MGRKDKTQNAEQQEKTEKPKKSRRLGSFMSTLIIIICLCVMGYAGYNIFTIRSEEHKADAEYEDIKSTEHIVKREVKDPKTGEIEIKEVVDVQPLRVVNKDFIAWIRIPDTVIDYPIVQAKDNLYYLSHTFNNKPNKAGAIFMECKNSADFSDKNTLIYGHHMKRGVMFAKLVEYKSQKFYEEHKEFYVYLPENKTFKVQVFAAYECEADYNFTQISFSSEEKFVNYVQKAKKISRIKTDVEVSKEDRIITLSTCDYEFEDARFIVVGKLIEI